MFHRDSAYTLYKKNFELYWTLLVIFISQLVISSMQILIVHTWTDLILGRGRAYCSHRRKKGMIRDMFQSN